MMRIRRSIKGQLFLLLFAFTSLLLIGTGSFLYRQIKIIVFAAVDWALQEEVKEIGEIIHRKNNGVEAELREMIQLEYETHSGGRYYEVLMDGKILAASSALTERAFDFAAARPPYGGRDSLEAAYTCAGPGGGTTRVFVHDIKARGRTFSIYAAEELGPSIRLIRTFRNFLLLVISSGIATVCLAGFWIAKWSLNPLQSFSRKIQKITHTTLGERIDAKAEAAEVSDLADAFNKMLDRLQRVFESERRFVADASHELKTPVSVIRAQCDVVLQKERRSEEYIVALKDIRSVSDNISALVRDLLCLSRLDSGVLSPEAFVILPLNEHIRKWADALRPLAAKRGIRVVVTPGKDIAIAGDPDRLKEAFLNIMENGLKYNRENGLLDISSAIVDGGVAVSIRDTGVGIKECDRGKIFSRFYRADSSRSLDGTGLGLSIAKMIIETHGGCIEVESTPEVGSTFVITLPALMIDSQRSS